jgi:hypothetical protein
MEDTKTSVKPFFGIIRALGWDSHQNIGNHLLQAMAKKLHPHGVFMSQEWKRKKGKGEDSDDDEVVDPAIANRKRFITKQWTAWPLPTHRVPREKEHLPGNVFFQQRRRINDQKTFAKRQEGKQAPSEMLEQVLTAVVLRKAKERIRVRNNPALKPAYDDEESERLVKPVVRDVIARLDTLLLGLHQEREHYVNGSFRVRREETRRGSGTALKLCRSWEMNCLHRRILLLQGRCQTVRTWRKRGSRKRRNGILQRQKNTRCV